MNIAKSSGQKTKFLIETIHYNFEDDMMQEINKKTGEYDVLGDDNISPLLEKQYRDLITES